MGLREKMQQMKEMMGRETTPLDLNRFGDPLATQIEWTPAKRGGTNIKTHSLVQVEPNRIEFRASNFSTNALNHRRAVFREARSSIQRNARSRSSSAEGWMMTWYFIPLTGR